MISRCYDAGQLEYPRKTSPRPQEPTSYTHLVSEYGFRVSSTKLSTPSSISVDDIQAWAASGESEVLEFKLTTGQKEEAAKAVCGMLNGRGGRVIFGIDPKGNVVGQQVSDKTLEDIAATLQKIKPEVQPHIDRTPISEDRSAITVTAESGRFRPYLYRGLAYRRMGATTQPMTFDEQQKCLLEQAFGSARWESERSPLTIDDIDAQLLSNVLSSGVDRQRIDASFLRGGGSQKLLLGLGLLQENKLNHAGAVLFGQNTAIELHYLQCVVKLAVFRGTTTADLAEVRQVYGNAFTILREAESFISSRLRINSKLTPGQMRRQDIPELPGLAVREALANAVAHREYQSASGSLGVKIFDDRVEIASIGTLHFGLIPDELYAPHQAQPWNPKIAQVLYRSGIVESLGTGTLRMVDHTREAGLPAPTITTTSQAVQVTFTRPGFFSPMLTALKLSAEQLRIIDAVAHQQPATRSGLVAETGLTERGVRSILSGLRDMILVALRGERKAARWHLAGITRRAYGFLEI